MRKKTLIGLFIVLWMVLPLGIVGAAAVASPILPLPIVHQGSFDLNSYSHSLTDVQVTEIGIFYYAHGPPDFLWQELEIADFLSPLSPEAYATDPMYVQVVTFGYPRTQLAEMVADTDTYIRTIYPRQQYPNTTDILHLRP